MPEKQLRVRRIDDVDVDAGKTTCDVVMLGCPRVYMRLKHSDDLSASVMSDMTCHTSHVVSQLIAAMTDRSTHVCHGHDCQLSVCHGRVSVKCLSVTVVSVRCRCVVPNVSLVCRFVSVCLSLVSLHLVSLSTHSIKYSLRFVTKIAERVNSDVISCGREKLFLTTSNRQSILGLMKSAVSK